MEISWKVYLTEAGYRTRCNCGEFEGEHSLGRHHVINRVDIFDERKGYCMEVYDPMNCGGSVDTIDYLKSLGLSMDDVRFIEPENISDEDREINEIVRRLEVKDIFPTFDCNGDVCIVPAVQEGGLVEYQVSDGMPHHRGTSFDVYTYSEAKKIFDDIEKHGWKKASQM